VVEDPECLDGLAGLAAASSALTTAGRPVRFELEMGGDECGPPGGFPSRAGTWELATTSAVAALRERGSRGPLLVVRDDGRRAAALVSALRASGEDLTEAPAERFDAAAAGSVEVGSLVLVATDRAGARPVVQAMAQATGATVPVVLAPWLLDASVLTGIADDGLSVLIATLRGPSSGEAVGYRVSEARSPGGGWAITAAGYEAYLAALEALTGGAAAPAVPGVYSAARVSVLPTDLDHPSESGWAKGIALVRVAGR
jgi:hypothetical protein